MKRLTLIIIGVLLCTPLYSDMNPYIAGVPVAYSTGGTGPNITFYFNCNSTDVTQTPGVGTGNVTLNANGWSTTAGAVGNALLTSTGWRRITASTDNIDTSVGTVGFYYYPDALTASASIFYVASTIHAKVHGSTTTTLRWTYGNGIQNITSALAEDTLVYIELSWDFGNGLSSVRINGGEWVQIDTITGESAPAASGLYWGHESGTACTAWWDQLLISDEYQADLYSVRNNTSF